MSDCHTQEKLAVGNANFGDNYGVINQGAQINQQTINLLSARSADNLIQRLNPILDASHTRDRKRSPPDSECYPGTRKEPIDQIIVWVDCGKMMYVCTTESCEKHPGQTFISATPWTDPDSAPSEPSDALTDMLEVGSSSSLGSGPSSPSIKMTPHIYWLHGFAGCGKSSISLEVAKVYAGSGRLLASYFFFRGAADRSRMDRFAATLASQLVAAIPATAPLIQNALMKEPGLIEGRLSLARQLDLLVLTPFRTAVGANPQEEPGAQSAYLIIVDGLDECEDKQGVEDFIEHMLDFFKEHPSIPLRLFIASRVEEHIRERLETDMVHMCNLGSHSPDQDILKYLDASFQAEANRDRVIRAYVTEHGKWPRGQDMGMLIEHIGGSFVLASTIFKFIVQPATVDDPLTPMERLPLAFKMHGLDGMYAQTLARSQHLPHFQNVISTIALLDQPLPVVEIANLLAIQTFEVVRVLLNLQGIIHVPGTDDKGEVTLCHTSLRDFLTTQTRSKDLWVPTSFHLCMAYYIFARLIEVEKGDRNFLYCTEMAILFHLKSEPSLMDSPATIRQFEARQSLFVDRGVSSHAFLCSMFYCFIVCGSPRPNILSYLFYECARHLALAVESPDDSVRRWLEAEVSVPAPKSGTWSAKFARFNYQTREAVKKAAAAINAKFPECLGRQCDPTGSEQEFYYVTSKKSLSGIEIFRALEWMIARAHLHMEQSKRPQHPQPKGMLERMVARASSLRLRLPPLELAIIYHGKSGDFCFRVDIAVNKLK